MERPHDCPESVYDVMRDCWSLKPADRPSWKMLVNALQSLYIGEEDKKISLARVYMNVNTVTFYLRRSRAGIVIVCFLVSSRRNESE